MNGKQSLVRMGMPSLHSVRKRATEGHDEWQTVPYENGNVIFSFSAQACCTSLAPWQLTSEHESLQVMWVTAFC